MRNSKTYDALVDSNMVREIYQQPQIWKLTYDSLLEQQKELSSFLKKPLAEKGLKIILTGAGTSAFIGEILLASFYRHMGACTTSIPTTDIVTHPTNFFHKTTPTLLVSFARSGDSPESVATFELAEEFHDFVYHLVITCNAEGRLARIAEGKKNCYTFLLPEGANDQALAMTSSFTAMTLAGLLISDIRNLEKNQKNVVLMAMAGQVILDQYSQEIKTIAQMDFKRIVFLGSGPLKGTAKESQLKIIELTDGEITCQHESYLGFRHGPKAVLTESTLLIYLLSNQPYVNRYERDLIRSINDSEKYLFSIGIGQTDEDSSVETDMVINASTGCELLPDEYFSICSTLPAQLLGFYKSLELGLSPDSPSLNGGIHRVVQGVTIYPFEENRSGI